MAIYEKGISGEASEILGIEVTCTEENGIIRYQAGDNVVTFSEAAHLVTPKEKIMARIIDGVK